MINEKTALNFQLWKIQLFQLANFLGDKQPFQEINIVCKLKNKIGWFNWLFYFRKKNSSTLIHFACVQLSLYRKLVVKFLCDWNSGRFNAVNFVCLFFFNSFYWVLIGLQNRPDGALGFNKQILSDGQSPLLIWHWLKYNGQLSLVTAATPYILWFPNNGFAMPTCRLPCSSLLSIFLLKITISINFCDLNKFDF